MRCTSPRTAWIDPQGGKPIFALWSGVSPGREFLIGCGRCLGCTLDRASSWALRAQHEARYYERNSFLTLTWSDEHFPESPEAARLEVRRFQARFYKEFGSHRFFGCLETGSKSNRIHAHLVPFGEDFKDGGRVVGKSKSGDPLWTNPVLERLWPFGIANCGEFTPASAAYISRYICKKAEGVDAVPFTHPVTGEIRMWPTVYRPFYPSRPALGMRFLDEFSEDVWSGLRARGGAHLPTPRAYSKRLKLVDPDRYEQAVEDRIVSMTAKRDLYEESPARQEVKDEVIRARLNFFSSGRS